MGGGAAEATESNNNAAAGGGGVGGGGGADVTVHIRCSNGSKFSVQISLDSTVGSFKSVVAQNCDIPAEQQRLIYKGRILKDDQALESYGLEADHTVHLVRGFAPATSADTTGATNTGVPNSTPSGVRSVSSDEGGAFGGSGVGASPFPGLGFNGLGGSGGLFGVGLPEFEQVQQQLTENPNLMREIINMPLVQNLMNNPDVMRNMIMNNPQMREMIDRNPELAHILNDPNTLRQTLEATRNPELMREMMRNTDRAMSNIESSPEGFNMLRRMYENIQEPLLNATTMAGDARNDLGSNPFAALLGTTPGGGQGRDQSTNPTSTDSETTTNSPAPNANPLPNPWASGGVNMAAGGAQTNSTTRSNPAGDARLPAVGGLGGLGLPEMFGSTQDTASLSQFMQNPAVSQMMQSLLSNPQYMNQILGLNSQQSNMLGSNSQLREMMQNPEFIRQLTSPETMQQLMTLQQTLLSQLGRQPSTQEAGQTGGGTGTLDNMGLEMLMNMFGGLGIGSPAVPVRSDVPPEELYATQLSQLQEMGFFDTRENIQALIATAGNVHAAVERLLQNPGQ
ncbi:ubiquitin domain-containing protein DSK2b-like isoform X2 [Camellia sinensis]|uniref:ubiquitin domain-containing protein DSK2b-like isoform X2 n=1 Tax=Camellia sinensis TaxID=4442 RepID=UPI0010359A82|nr:ubiquitin domain-containing protein DSK2b-like isoform X2 [Camellia sinensis]